MSILIPQSSTFNNEGSLTDKIFNILSMSSPGVEEFFSSTVQKMLEARKDRIIPSDYDEFEAVKPDDIIHFSHQNESVSHSVETLRSYIASKLTSISYLDRIPSSLDEYLEIVIDYNGSFLSPLSQVTVFDLKMLNETMLVFPIIQYMNGMIAGGFLHSIARTRSPGDLFTLDDNQDIDIYFKTPEDLKSALIDFTKYMKALRRSPVTQQFDIVFNVVKVTEYAVSMNCVFKAKTNELCKSISLQFIAPFQGEQSWEEILCNFDNHGVMAGWTKDEILCSKYFNVSIENDTYLINKLPRDLPMRSFQRLAKYRSKNCLLLPEQQKQLLNYFVENFTLDKVEKEKKQMFLAYGTVMSDMLYKHFVSIALEFLSDIAAMSDNEGKVDAELLIYSLVSTPSELKEALRKFHARISGLLTRTKYMNTKRSWNLLFKPCEKAQSELDII